MARTPTRLAGPALVDATAETVYTVPGSTITVIKNVVITNPSGGALTLTLSIGADAAGTRFVNALAVPAGATKNLHFYIPMAATQIIQAKSDGDDVMILTIGGDQYPA